MNEAHLKFDRFEQAIEEQTDIEFSVHAEKHLQECDQCRAKLEEIAAADNWWSKASDYLKSDKIDEDFSAVTCEFDLSGNIPIENPARSKPDHDSDKSGGKSRRVDQANIQTSKSNKNSSTKTQSETETKAKTETKAEADVSGSDPIEELTHRSALDPASHPEMLGRIGHYDIEQVIGRGGMGVVYKGYDSQLNRAVAIKVLSPHLASNATARKRFDREARAAAAVVHHNVIPIHGVNSKGKLPYIVMPLVAGKSLQEHVEENGPLETKDIIRIAMQIAAGLDAAHKQGLVHRDIKPANILIEEDVSRVTITDFGLARAADDAAMTQTGWLAGTPHYMSPEQSKGRSVSHSSDLFSLGSLMYFMATGRVPFRGDGPMAVLNVICNEDVTPVRQVNADVPRRLGNIIEKLLEKHPSDRFKSASHLHRVLEEHLAYMQQPDSKKPPRNVMTQRALRNRSYLVAMASGFLLLLTFGFWFSQWNSNRTSTEHSFPAIAHNLSELAESSTVPASAEFSGPANFQFSDNSVVYDLMPDVIFVQELQSLERDLEQFAWSTPQTVVISQEHQSEQLQGDQTLRPTIFLDQLAQPPLSPFGTNNEQENHRLNGNFEVPDHTSESVEETRDQSTNHNLNSNDQKTEH